MKRTLFFLILLSSISCTTEIPFPEYEGEQKLVIGCLFTTDSVFSVHVHHTQPIFDTMPNYVNNANVELWSNDSFLEKLERIDDGHYISTIEKAVDIKPYTLKVSADGFPSVQATDSIPEKQIIISKAIAFSVGYNNETASDFHTIDFNFTNNTKKQCYFENFLASKQYYYTDSYRDEEGNLHHTDSIYISTSLVEYIDSNEAFVEIDKVYSFEGQKNLIYSNSLMNSYETSMLLRFNKNGGNIGRNLILFHASLCKNNYMYKKSLKQHIKNQGQYDPMTVDEISELFSFGAPKEVFTNIKGGYGIFAGYSVDTVVFDIDYNDLY